MPSSAIRSLRRRLEGQAAEAEKNAAVARGQPRSLVARDAIHARVASKTASLANAKRKSEQLKQERKELSDGGVAKVELGPNEAQHQQAEAAAAGASAESVSFAIPLLCRPVRVGMGR